MSSEQQQLFSFGAPRPERPSAPAQAPARQAAPAPAAPAAPAVPAAPVAVPGSAPVIDLSTLNPAQRQAAECTKGPLLVLAGAGSGKTRVLTYRIAHMINDEGVRPWQILAITFTNKAAAEMRERLGNLLPGGTRGMWICTFHAMCVRMLREDGELLGYQPNFTIYDDDDSKRLVKNIMGDLDIDQKQCPLPSIRSKISQAKNGLVSPEEMEAHAQSPVDRAAARVYHVLETFRNEKGQPTNRRRLIGKLDEESGMLVPNDAYYEFCLNMARMYNYQAK